MAITLKQIDDEINVFTINKNKLRDHAHTVAMLIFMHAAPKEVGPDCVGSGDCTRALKLVKAMPKSWAEQMVVWFKEFTPVRIVAKNDKCEYDPKYKKLSAEEKLTWWKLAEANMTPYHELSEEPDVAKPLDWDAILKMVEGLGKRINKAIEENRVPEHDIESAKAVAEKVTGLKLTRIRKTDPKPAANANKSQSDANKSKKPAKDNVTMLENAA